MDISVIIPTFKPENYLWECLLSLKNQTLSHECYEIILVLNGDKEPYYSGIQYFLDNEFDESYNISFLFTEMANVSNARNLGLDIAKGEYITFLDDDDYVSEDYLSELLKVASVQTIALAHPVAISEGKTVNYSIENEYYKISSKGIVPFMQARRVFQGTWMKLFHKDIIGHRRFDLSFKNGEDALFMFLVSDKFVNICSTAPSAIYYRRIRQNGLYRKKKSISYSIRNAVCLSYSYSTIYLSRPWRYNFIFFITRILGTIKTLMKSIYNAYKN